MEVSPVGLLKNYGCAFEEFKHKVEGMKNEENFEWEDDLLDWGFAVENLEYYTGKKRRKKSEIKWRLKCFGK